MSNTQINVEHNAELSAPAVASYKSQSSDIDDLFNDFSRNGVSNVLPRKTDARQAVDT